MYLTGEVKDSSVRDMPRQESVYDAPGGGYPQFVPEPARQGGRQAPHQAHALLSGEMKDYSGREPSRQREADYEHQAHSYMKVDARSGRSYYDLNAALQTYRGPWLFGQQHVDILVSGLRAQWDQFFAVPADLPDGVPLAGNVLHRQGNGAWQRSSDRFEGRLATQHLVEPGRFFIGQTEHTLHSSMLPGGLLKVAADLRIHLNQVGAAGSVVPLSLRR